MTTESQGSTRTQVVHGACLLLLLGGVLVRGCDDGRVCYIGLVGRIGGGRNCTTPAGCCDACGYPNGECRSTRVAGKLGRLVMRTALVVVVVEETPKKDQTDVQV